MKLQIFQIDAFTKQLFSGNPAAVVLCDSELSSDTMQSVAYENNLSETAFIFNANNNYHIRWFTPKIEVDLCGHATLAAGHVLFNHLKILGSKVTFNSKRGPLIVRKKGDILFLDFPADPIVPAEPIDLLIAGLGAEPVELYRGRDDYLAIFDNEDTIASLRPDVALISQVPSRGVIISSIGNEVDFVSRFFAPQAGVAEDPVTGSAHTTLIPYWSNRLAKIKLFARQISKRGGDLICTNLGERVEIGGHAVTYLAGEIFL
jgi:PhzF family phenazine biosynthesis protein